MDFFGLGTFFVCSEVANIFDKVTILKHFWDLCAKVGLECTEHLARAQAATQTRDWYLACSEWTWCGDVIVGSGLLNRDDRLWLLGCHALVLANFWAFYRNDIGHALRDAIAASKARDEVKNVPEALDFKSYTEATLLKVMYLWAITSDLEEEALGPGVKTFLVNKLGHAGSLVSDSEVRTLKEECEAFVMNNSESVIWEVQKDYFTYFEIEESLRCAREGSKLYEKKHPDKVDYVSKLNEAFILCVSGAFKKSSEVCEALIYNLDSKPWKVKSTNAHPAGLYCNPQYDYFTHFLRGLCYQQMIAQSSRGENNTTDVEHVNKEEAELLSLYAQSEYSEVFSYERYRLVESFEYIAKKKYEVWEEGYENCSRDQTKWIHFAVSSFLEKSQTDFRTKYRHSYENGSRDESHFLNAKLCLEQMLKLNFPLSPIEYSRVRIFMDFVRLYHEKDRQVMFLKQSPSVAVEENATILEHAENTTEWYMKLLLRRTKDDDYWVLAQKFCSDLYYMLQFHYFAKWIATHGCTLASTCDIKFTDRLYQLWNQSLMSELTSAETAVSQKMWKQSLVWAERRVGKATYFQLAPNMMSTAMTQLLDFDLNDDVAWNALKSSRAACGPATVVLEYFVSEACDLQFVYVMTKDDDVFMQILKVNTLHSMLWKILKWLRNICSLTHECRGALINGILELLYEILISPVANFLDGMQQEDKLIIVAPEILSDVPFAALRKPDSPQREGYLIQSHTISVTPSLRILQHCNERLKKLDQNVLDTKPGTIVAVGDPACKERLKWSSEEVNFIEKLLGEEHVKKLVGPEATPSEVLKWAKYPSENSVKQVVFHIAAHGIGQDDGLKVKKGAIKLARPPRKLKKESTVLALDLACQQNYDITGQEGMPRAKDDENFDNDNAHDKTQLGELFTMLDKKEETQISGHGEVGGTRNAIVCPISKCAPHLLKSENISGCGFQWEAHMVVLSACDTARGQITGEAVLNLPRALMIAGVPCVVVSQWKVGDSSTCELMKSFYEELTSGKEVSSCLRAAMLKMMKDEPNVHEWAPFFVCGLPTVCLPKDLQGGTSSCNVHDYGTSSDRKTERRGKNVKVKLLDLTDWQIQRFFNSGECAACLECNLEYRIVFDNDEDAKTLKNLLAKAEKINEKGDWTYKDVVQLNNLVAKADYLTLKHLLMEGRALEELEDVEEFDKLLAKTDCTTANHLLMQGGALGVLTVKVSKMLEKVMTDEDVKEVKRLKAMGDYIVASANSIVAKHLQMEGK